MAFVRKLFAGTILMRFLRVPRVPCRRRFVKTERNENGLTRVEVKACLACCAVRLGLSERHLLR